MDEDEQFIAFDVVFCIIGMCLIGWLLYSMVCDTDAYILGEFDGYDEHNVCIYNNALTYEDDYFLMIGGIYDDSYMYMMGYISGYETYMDKYNLSLTIEHTRIISGC